MVATRAAIREQQGAAAAADLRFLTGVRALASCGIVCVHSFMLWQFFLPYRVKRELTHGNPAILLASAGMAWVDVLLVVSAALAAYHLVPQLEEQGAGGPGCGRLVHAYWGRRLRRIGPAYLAANLLVAVALGPAEVPHEAAAARWMNYYNCPDSLWANVLLVQNFLGNRACAIHLWTVAVQTHFYLLFPLLAWALRPDCPGFRTRLACALVAAFVGGTAWRLAAAWRADFLELPVADFAVDERSQLAWAHMLHASYLPTLSRAAELAAGAALGLALRSPAALRTLRRRGTLLMAAALALQASYAYLLLAWHPLFRAPGTEPWPPTTARLYVALLSWGSPFVAALVTITLAGLAARSDPLHAAAARMLASPAWRPAADLSYCLFLVHEQARLWLILLLPAGWLPRAIVAWPLASFAGVAGSTLAAGYLCALPLYRLVERPWLGGRP